MYSHTAKYQCHSHNKDSSNPHMFIPGPEKFSSNLGRGWTWKTEGNSKPVVFQCNTFPTTVKQQPNRASQCLYGITINVPITWAFFLPSLSLRRIAYWPRCFMYSRSKILHTSVNTSLLRWHFYLLFGFFTSYCTPLYSTPHHELHLPLFSLMDISCYGCPQFCKNLILLNFTQCSKLGGTPGKG